MSALHDALRRHVCAHDGHDWRVIDRYVAGRRAIAVGRRCLRCGVAGGELFSLHRPDMIVTLAPIEPDRPPLLCRISFQ